MFRRTWSASSAETSTSSTILKILGRPSGKIRLSISDLASSTLNPVTPHQGVRRANSEVVRSTRTKIVLERLVRRPRAD